MSDEDLRYLKYVIEFIDLLKARPQELTIKFLNCAVSTDSAKRS